LRGFNILTNSENNVLKNELTTIENKFNNNLSNLALKSATENEIMIPEKKVLLTQLIHKDFQVDVNDLSKTTNDLIVKNEKMSDEEIAIQLLKKLASTNKSKFMKKIASEMIKEEWWKK
jgi:ribosomal protein L18E